VQQLIPIIEHAVHKLLVLTYFVAPFALIGAAVVLYMAWRLVRAIERVADGVASGRGVAQGGTDEET